MITEDRQMEFFDEHEKPADAVTVQELEAICEKVAKQRAVVEEIGRQKSDAQAELDRLEGVVLSHLEALGKQSYASKVGNFGVSYRSTVRIPQGDDRAKFFEHLKEIGEFNELITVNSQTLNGWYKEKRKFAEEIGKGMSFSVPGIEEPNLIPQLSFKRKGN
jgi:hypothetical protein